MYAISLFRAITTISGKDYLYQGIYLLLFKYLVFHFKKEQFRQGFHF